MVMRENYDFSKSVKNPYAKRLKKQITIRIDENTISYFKEMAESKGIPYQSLINLYLRDCAVEHRELQTTWG
jgi:predicted DNA binding CopG/RHH family protein